MQKLSVTKRPAQIKGPIASRPELHGDDVVGALTVSIGGILLFSKDLVKMYNDEDAHNRLFRKSDAGLVPAFPGTILYLTEIFKGAKVTLQTVDMDEALILKPATVKDIVLEAQDAGGQVLMACKILGAPSEESGVNPLHMLNKKCTIAILNGSLAEKDDNQRELALDGAEPGEGETAADREEAEATAAVTNPAEQRRIAAQLAEGRKHPDDEEPESGIAKKIRRSARKRGK